MSKDRCTATVRYDNLWKASVHTLEARHTFSWLSRNNISRKAQPHPIFVSAARKPSLVVNYNDPRKCMLIFVFVGVAMNDVVYICTKIARQMDAQGLDKIFDTAEAASAAIEEARPLLQRDVELVKQVIPNSE